jgi:hypothetical protein
MTGQDEWTSAMRAGDYERAWALTAAALAARDRATRDDPALPYHRRWVWDGTPLAGRDVLVRCYHGLGDTIQFARFLPALAGRARVVTVEAPARLVPLIAGIVKGRVVPFDPARPLEPAEVDVEIMELGAALRLSPVTTPPPYLEVAAEALPAGTIGLCWTAGDWDSDRAVPEALLATICARHRCVSLVAAPTTLPVLNREGCPFDIAATAALVAGVERVVTVDTMIAHLAGALGKPTWLMLKHAPDWRWSPARGRSDWYPAMKLYTQPAPGAWGPVVAEVARDLARDVAAARRQRVG